MKPKNLNFAFTLAETLIVIGIIGVVAALTLPNLNHATGDKEKVTRVKKAYSALSESFDRASVIYGSIDEWFKNDSNYLQMSERAGKRIAEFMKVSKDCGMTESGCFSSNIKDYDGNAVDAQLLQTYYKFTLPDGMSIAITNMNMFAMDILVDIDGPNKGKSREGDDLFEFTYLYDNPPAPSAEDWVGASRNQLYPTSNPTSLTGNFNKTQTTAWIIQNDNADYLKCPDELNWETKTSCN